MSHMAIERSAIRIDLEEDSMELSNLSNDSSEHIPALPSTADKKMSSDRSLSINIDEKHSSIDQGKCQAGNPTVNIQSQASQEASFEIMANEAHYPSAGTTLETNRENPPGDLECNDSKQAGSDPNLTYVLSESINHTDSEGMYFVENWWDLNKEFIIKFHLLRSLQCI